MCEGCAFSRETGCAVLTIKQCALGNPCSFFKTVSELEAGRAKANARIAQFTEAEQQLINTKYHGYKPRQLII